MTGRIVHFEIPFDDGDRARAFYSDVFGWQAQEMPEMEYTMAMTGPVGDDGMPTEPGYINGGMFQRDGQAQRAGADDRRRQHRRRVGEGRGAAAARRSRASMAVGDMGFAAYINDSEGNLIGLWENAS